MRPRPRPWTGRASRTLLLNACPVLRDPCCRFPGFQQSLGCMVSSSGGPVGFKSCPFCRPACAAWPCARRRAFGCMAHLREAPESMGHARTPPPAPCHGPPPRAASLAASRCASAVARQPSPHVRCTPPRPPWRASRAPRGRPTAHSLAFLTRAVRAAATAAAAAPGLSRRRRPRPPARAPATAPDTSLRRGRLPLPRLSPLPPRRPPLAPGCAPRRRRHGRRRHGRPCAARSPRLRRPGPCRGAQATLARPRRGQSRPPRPERPRPATPAAAAARPPDRARHRPLPLLHSRWAWQQRPVAGPARPGRPRPRPAARRPCRLPPPHHHRPTPPPPRAPHLHPPASRPRRPGRASPWRRVRRTRRPRPVMEGRRRGRGAGGRGAGAVSCPSWGDEQGLKERAGGGGRRGGGRPPHPHRAPLPCKPASPARLVSPFLLPTPASPWSRAATQSPAWSACSAARTRWGRGKERRAGQEGGKELWVPGRDQSSRRSPVERLSRMPSMQQDN
jgi:hypothetical protein